MKHRKFKREFPRLRHELLADFRRRKTHGFTSLAKS